MRSDLASGIRATASGECLCYTVLHLGKTRYLRLPCSRVFRDDLHNLARSRLRRRVPCDLQYRVSEDLRKRIPWRTRIDRVRERAAIAHYGLRQQVTLRFEIPKERTPGSACRLGYVIHRCLIEAFVGEQVYRGIPDGISHQLLLTGLQCRDGSDRVRWFRAPGG
jgi:hypothetical protein